MRYYSGYIIEMFYAEDIITTVTGKHPCCEVDTHTDMVCTALKQAFESRGCSSCLVPYPGPSGLQFRYAARTAAGQFVLIAAPASPTVRPA